MMQKMRRFHRHNYYVACWIAAAVLLLLSLVRLIFL